jgi:C-8 sterol isomerase
LGSSKGYCCAADGWMLEYARGFIPLGLPYFICSSLFVTVDIFPWLTAVWKVGTQTAYNLLVNRKI